MLVFVFELPRDWTHNLRPADQTSISLSYWIWLMLFVSVTFHSFEPQNMTQDLNPQPQNLQPWFHLLSSQEATSKESLAGFHSFFWAAASERVRSFYWTHLFSERCQVFIYQCWTSKVSECPEIKLWAVECPPELLIRDQPSTLRQGLNPQPADFTASLYPPELMSWR